MTTENMAEQYFLRMITLLRQEERVLLYATIPGFNETECEAVIRFLNEEYQKEKLDYPGTTPEFEPVAALWAAQYVYITAQLILFRETPEALLSDQLPEIQPPNSVGSILSADLCLRFLPLMLEEIMIIDPEDALVNQILQTLKSWHYSAAGFKLITELEHSDLYTSHSGLLQLYCNRIISCKNSHLRDHKAFEATINASYGIHTTTSLSISTDSE